MPTEDGLRSDQDQMLLPGRAESPNHEPEGSIPAVEGKPGPSAERDLELVAQEQVLDHKVVPLTEEGSQSREEDAKEFKHPGRVADRAGRRFALLQACTGYRNPLLLAKIADTVDSISGGRLVLGLGAGDSAGEHQTMWLPTDSPVSRFEEALQIIRTLLRDGHLDHSGPFYTVRDAVLVPRGPRPEGPPILIGTLNPRPRMRRMVAQYADVWNGWLGYTDASAEAGKHQSDQILETCGEHGRDPSTLVRTVAVRVNVPGSGYPPAPGERPLAGSPEEMAEVLRGHAALGIKQVQLALTMGGREGVQAFAPVIRSLRA
jgi:alkanesulfonate monooxygenase SsuD/methylene tetrahydromethanopterin reductase-like flavin-dependent oxidoreductase (luciferase family)